MEVTMKDQRLEKLARVLVEYSTGVKPGDNVCVSGEDSAIPFIKEVVKQAILAGGNVKWFVDMPELDEFLLKNGRPEQIEQPNYRFGECARADVWISAWGTDNVSTLSSIDGDTLKRRRLANSENRKIYNTRSGNGELRWCGTQFPLNGDAQYAGMSLNEYEDFVYGAGFIDRDDPVAEWKKMSEYQQKWADRLNKVSELEIFSENTHITLSVKDRKWINCCGNENFPDGEIFTSPVEDSVNGYITFSYPALMNGNEFKNVRLEFENGKIIKASCDDEQMNQKLLTYIDTDEGSRFLGEVAFGTNYGIKRFSRNILFDEKIGGTMHMALGAGFPEAGGKNDSAIHWDMINDMTKCGRVLADGVVIYENGRFKDELL